MKEYLVLLDVKESVYKENTVIATFFRISNGFMYFYQDDQTNTVACFKIDNIVYVRKIS